MLVLALVLALGAGCGDESERVVVSDDSGPQHIHGLGEDPADGSLYIATHTGLWRAPAGSQKARRVGDSFKDIMGFTVAGPTRFLGSGHPDARDDLPPLLGLIESGDGGRSWRSVSLLGKADFHVLRFASGRVYGVDSTSGKLMRSRDGGKSWRTLASPGAVMDLAIRPGNPSSLVASTERGLVASTDAGARWRPVNRVVGALAWPRPDRLYLITPEGQTLLSSDRGRRFQRLADVGGQPDAFASAGDALLAALHDSTVKQSTDGGRSWTIRARP
jgi:hypothetical protein